MKYKQGAQWHKWDLHVHTPYSIVNQYEGQNLDDKWERFITDLEALPKEFKVLGINDYLFIDGYEKILEYKKAGRLNNIDTFFPVIEFRIKKFGGHREFKRVNFHVIFSDEVKPEIIRQQFLNQLYGKYKLTPGYEGIDWFAAITNESLQDLGKKIKETVPADKLKDFGSDLEEGFNNINFDEEEITRLLKQSTYLKWNFITAIGKTEWEEFKWNDNTIAEKKTVINNVDFVFTSSESISKYNAAKAKLKEEKVNDLLLDCSDAHYNVNASQKDRIGKCFTWINSDTTFAGLKQVIIESDRLFVGGIPPLLDRIQKSPNKFISKILVRRINSCNMSEIWFDDLEIPINPSLVAIIGNKGNGKSALTDIIGLVGNSYNDNYSFLTRGKFRNPKPYNKAANIEAQLHWVDNNTDGFLNLASTVDLNRIEKVKYIPQNFLETLCASEDEQEFEKEIKKIIFSHTPDTDRLGFTDLDSLMNYHSEIINKEVGTIKGEIDDINQKIIILERKQIESYKLSLKEGLKSKEDELIKWELLKPVTVAPPAENTDLQKRNNDINTEINTLRVTVETKTKLLKEKTSEKTQLQQDLGELQKLKQALQNLQKQISNFSETQSASFERFGIKKDEVFKYELTLEPIDKIINVKTNALEAINIIIFGNSITSGLETDISNIDIQITSLEEKLDEPYRLYQKYLQENENWKKRKEQIIGAEGTHDTIEFYKRQIKYVETELPEEIEKNIAKRNRVVEQLFTKKSDLIKLYNSSYKPITDFIDKYGHLMKDHEINISAEFTLDGFIQKFFDHVSQGAKGTYIGVEEGNKYLIDLISSSNLNDTKGIIDFLASIRESLIIDKRTGEKDATREIEKQLRKSYSIEDLYRFLYYLDYLKPTFKLNLGTKSLSTLSPGERGALLLIFYLFLDKDDKPLIIDQPEENLDNQSVYTYLVHFIKEAKQKRQIIMVTHNPNLAVVCDAEQIIHISIDKSDNYKVSYKAGAIENPDINRAILDILEGTKPAFKNRTNKYSMA